jgi:hypothetical protein
LEIELGEVVLKVALAHMLLGAVESTLKHAEVVLDGVGTSFPANAFLLRVAHNFMTANKHALGASIASIIIGHNPGLFADLILHDPHKGEGVHRSQ